MKRAAFVAGAVAACSAMRDAAAQPALDLSELAEAIETQESHTPHGSTVGPCTQFRHAARILAIEVLPVPREPTNR